MLLTGVAVDVWAEGRSERTAQFVAEFVQRKVDVIVTHPATSVLIAKQATSVIPIVFPVSLDPVEAGVVPSLSRPDGNATGLSLLREESVGKRVELLREFVPRLRRLAIIANITGAQEFGKAQAAARAIGLEVLPLEIRHGDDIAPAFDAIGGRADALYVVAGPVVFVNRLRVATLALGARLPTIFSVREYLEAGGLLSYGPNFSDLFRRSAEMVDKILRGAKPADIPIEQPTKFDLVINLTTAKALGLTVPDTLLARADEVIE
jgi:ABC-type uncharacterized transport system substrate-binding protein